jgi:D-alanyl-lipoteichoic acid acyltransferase DltB (MBOAT superfamily)
VAVLFNSFDFLFFLTAVTAAYFALPHRFRWALLLAASCVFYMTFIPAYILILLGTIAIDYFAAIRIEDSLRPDIRKRYLFLSVLSVCAILFVFKYFNFFNSNVEVLARAIRWNYPIKNLRIILPIGLSFHTFQSLSYVIEVYRGRQKAERHFGLYALYVMYFPQLVAGPIERPQNLLHQFKEVRRFDWQRVQDGLFLTLWGLFKKVVVADCLAIYVSAVYDSATRQSGASLLLATYFFAVQIYGDFSGYSDMARGISRLYGIELMKNFETPYFSRSIGEFWSRWHISLSTWFKDYVYIPLGGNRVPPLRNAFNLMAVFLVSGLWHGANWTFLIWGGLHGLFLIGERCAQAVGGRLRAWTGWAEHATGPLWSAAKLLLTFHLVVLSWVFFRAPNLASAALILRKIAFDHGPLFLDAIVFQGLAVAAIALALEVFRPRASAVYAMGLVFAVVLFGVENGAQFIYFQF